MPPLLLPPASLPPSPPPPTRGASNTPDSRHTQFPNLTRLALALAHACSRTRSTGCCDISTAYVRRVVDNIATSASCSLTVSPSHRLTSFSRLRPSPALALLLLAEAVSHPPRSGDSHTPTHTPKHPHTQTPTHKTHAHTPPHTPTHTHSGSPTRKQSCTARIIIGVARTSTRNSARASR